MTKKSKKKVIKEAQELNAQIENLELDSMSATEIEKVVKAFSEEGQKLRRARKKVRYQLYRLRTDAEGKCSAQSTAEFKKRFESNPMFGGWRFFGVTWDVAFDDPYRIVHKDISEQEEWEELIKAKFPTIGADGKISYPDINVRKKIEAHAKKQAAKSKK